MCIIKNHSFMLANKNKHELVTFLTAAHICGWSCVHSLYKYFCLLTLLGDMSTFILQEALFCFKFELIRVQPFWFALYQWRTETVGWWHIWYFCHTFQPCSWCHWHRLLGAKWRHSWSCFLWCFNLDFKQTGPVSAIKCKKLLRVSLSFHSF